MNKVLRHAAFAAGLLALAWVGIVSVDAQPLALGITALIAAFYVAGAVELHRYQQSTDALARALAATDEAPADLPGWLATLPAALRNTVRRRVEGEAVGFAGPALAPYLAGLLVLLGMLGTFVGMVLTLRGTGLALDGASDLEAVRHSLTAPVRGLGFAFGTSIAGVATSAALGLMSALARGERARAAQALDARIATSLRGFSQVHQRETTLALLQRQAELMPTLVDTLQAMMTAMARQGDESAARLLASQDRFHGQAEAAYAGLAASVERSLRESLGEGARIAGETIRPVVESTLAGIARETATLHAALADTARGQVEQLSARFEAIGAGMASTLADTAGQTAALQAAMADVGAQQLDGVSSRLDGTVQRITQAWTEALAQHERASGQAAGRSEEALSAAAGRFEQHSAALLHTVGQAHDELETAAAAREQQRLAATLDAIEAMAATLRAEWQRAGDDALARQQQLGDALTGTARDIAAEVASHTRATLAEIGTLVQTAADAPRAAAEVVAELRAKLADSLARDNALLDERGRMLETLGTLQQAVQHAAVEQRGAIDALVASSAALLDRVGQRFNEQVDADAGRLAAVAAQVGDGAAQVGQLGEAFGAAVQRFGESNEALLGQLQRIEGALDKSLARSDEQLAYYVAQAREVVDLSILSQRQILENLQGLAGRVAEAA